MNSDYMVSGGDRDDEDVLRPMNFTTRHTHFPEAALGR